MDNWSEKCNKIKIKISSYRQNFCMGKKKKIITCFIKSYTILIFFNKSITFS